MGHLVHNFTKKFNMIHIFPDNQGLSKQQNIAMGHIFKNNSLNPTPRPKYENMKPSSCMNSSLDDLIKYIQYQLEHSCQLQELHMPHSIVHEQFWKQFITHSPFLSHGLGWFIYPYDDKKIVLHPGIAPGAISVIGFMPEKNFGFIILINTQAYHFAQATWYTILDMLHNKPDQNWYEYFYKQHDYQESPKNTQNIFFF